MENRINIGELLKDCPKGMELYSPLVGDCKFVKVNDYESKIIVELETGATVVFQTDGRYFDCPNAECILFPKGKTTWEGFVPPCQFKDGDVLVHTQNDRFIISIYKSNKNEQLINTHAILWDREEGLSVGMQICCYTDNVRLATKEEKEKLFKAIKDYGYKWNEETKTLKKLSKFKVGDRIILKDNPFNMPSIKITAVTTSQYILENMGFFYISSADEKYVLEDKFDITTLKPFDKVLVRVDNSYWRIQFFERINKKNKNYPFVCMNGNNYKQCIPYEGNEHLIGKTDDCDEYFKIWE